MKTLRGYVFVGAGAWTLGLLFFWAVFLTFHRDSFQSIAVIHRYPHALMLSGITVFLIGFLMVRRGLAPLDNLRQRLGEVRSGTARGVEGRYPAEVQPLVTDLNALLAHQDAAVSRAVAKAGDLAHGLKTPLAILALEAERAADSGQERLAAAISEQVERMRRQIEYHLAQARAAASGATPGARCAVIESAEPLARTLARLHTGRGVTIDVRVDAAVVVRCSREDLDEMLGNLLDNACKWAKSHVVLATAVRGGAIELRVTDDGPGLQPELRERVLQRGVRADEAAPGSGFGLAIVRDLAELYGGSIHLDAVPSGGLLAVLTLPAAE